MAKLSIMGVAQEQESRAPPAQVKTKRRDPTEPISHLVSMNHIEEIRRCLTQIEQADGELMELDMQLEPMVMTLNDANADPWDKLDIESSIEPLLEKRRRIEGTVYLAVTDISAHGTYLEDLDSIDVPSDAIERVAVEQPGALTHATWIRLVGEPCPF